MEVSHIFKKKTQRHCETKRNANVDSVTDVFHLSLTIDKNKRQQVPNIITMS
jgi:hypothetical protein